MIASITFIGQFPHGIDLHIRNLQWFFHNTPHHIYIIITPNIAPLIKAQDDVTVIVKSPPPHGTFIPFWREFPSIVKDISTDWFLLTEQDLWFYEQLDNVPDNPKTIKTFHKDISKYHEVMIGNKIVQPRVWEGTHLIHNTLIRKAIDANVDFHASNFLDTKRDYYEKLAGDTVGFTGYSKPDTMDEFSLFCALEGITMELKEKVVHMRGPETVHRQFPHVYNTCSQDVLDTIKEKAWKGWHIDAFLAVAMYYIAGTWDKCDHLNWKEAKIVKEALSKVNTAWMTTEEAARVKEVLGYL
jgi:hypothetical protein